MKDTTKTQKCTILNSSPERLEKNMAFFQWQKNRNWWSYDAKMCVCFFSRVRQCICKMIQQNFFPSSFLQQLCTLPWLSKMLGLRYITILQYWPFSNQKPLAMQWKKDNIDQVQMHLKKWKKIKIRYKIKKDLMKTEKELCNCTQLFYTKVQ